MTLLFALMGVALGVVSASKMPGSPPLADEVAAFLQVWAPEHLVTSRVDSCSFCRAVIAGRTDPCLGQADATTCRSKVINLRTHCQKLVPSPACKKPEEVSPEKEEGCTTTICAAVLPSCDVGSKVKASKDWKGCCFNQADDCTTDFCTVDNGGCNTNACCSHLSKVFCECNPGYRGDGSQCDGASSCQFRRVIVRPHLPLLNLRRGMPRPLIHQLISIHTAHCVPAILLQSHRGEQLRQQQRRMLRQSGLHPDWPR